MLVLLAPIAADLVFERKRIGSGQAIGPPADEKRVKRQRTGPAEVVASLRMNARDHPRAALERQREEAA